jgi:hypothetical protein
MVRSMALRFAVWLALLGMTCATLPIAVSADDAGAANGSEYHYATAITTVYGSQYPIAGHLDLEIFPSGVLRGYYHSAFQKAFIPVVGGRDGNYLWFDIGPSPVDLGIGTGNGRVHIVATMGANGSFKGQLYPQAVAGGGGSDISPVNQATSNDQYIFAATQVAKSSEDYPVPSPSP